MTFTQLFSLLWRNRVRISIVLGTIFVVTFLFLFAFSSNFHDSVLLFFAEIFRLVFYILLVLFGASLLWKGAMGNFKGGKGGGDKK